MLKNDSNTKSNLLSSFLDRFKQLFSKNLAPVESFENIVKTEQITIEGQIAKIRASHEQNKNLFFDARIYLIDIAEQVFNNYKTSPEFSQVFGDQPNTRSYFYNNDNSLFPSKANLEKKYPQIYFGNDDCDFKEDQTKAVAVVGSKYQSLIFSLEKNDIAGKKYWLKVNIDRADLSYDNPTEILCLISMDIKDLYNFSKKGIGSNQLFLTELTNSLVKILLNNTELANKPDKWMQIKHFYAQKNDQKGDLVKSITISGLELQGEFLGYDYTMIDRSSGSKKTDQILFDIVQNNHVLDLFSAVKTTISFEQASSSNLSTIYQLCSTD